MDINLRMAIHHIGGLGESECNFSVMYLLNDTLVLTKLDIDIAHLNRTFSNDLQKMKAQN